MTTLSTDNNIFETAARDIKVRQLCDALRIAFQLVALDVEPEMHLRAAEGFTNREWAALERLARVKNPASEKTRTMVLERLRQSVETWERAQVSAKRGWEL